MAENWTLASFFAGVGAIDHGFEETGKVKTIYANEFDPYAAQTYEQNFDLKVDGRDIHEVAPEEVPDADIFVGGFPVRLFSGGISSNMGEGGHNVQTGDMRPVSELVSVLSQA